MWLLPSRRRVANLQRFFAAYNATGGSTPGMVLVDTADYSDNTAAYDALELPLNWFIHYTHGATQGEKIAEVWAVVCDSGWLGLIGDDCVPETPHWDAALVDRLDGTNFVSCDDGWLAPTRVANCWVMSGALVRAVGYIFPPGLHHLYVDDVWETIGQDADCWTRAMTVMVRHRHVLKGEAPADETHIRVYGEHLADGTFQGGLWETDRLVFQEWLADERHIAVDTARKLRAAVSTSNRHKPALTGTKRHQPALTPAVHTRRRTQEERFEYAKTRKVMILTPIRDAPCWQYTDSFAKTVMLLERAGIEWDRRFVIGLSDIARARNDLAAQYLAASADDPSWDAMMIDDDMNWEPASVIRLLASEQPFVGAAGRKRVDRPNSDPGVWCAYLPEGQELDEMGNVSAPGAKVGGAFVRLRREVFETMMTANPHWKLPPLEFMKGDTGACYYEFYRQDDPWAVSPEMIAAGKVALDGHLAADEIFRAMLKARPTVNSGEDYTFCDRWNALGGRVWIDPSITLGHVGIHEYRGALCELQDPNAAKNVAHVEILSRLTGTVNGIH